MRDFKLRTMKKTFINIIFLCAFTLTGFCQAKKPTIMVVPSDVWCYQNGFVKEYDDMGSKSTISDYKAALLKNPDLTLAISKIGEMMSERGFNLKVLADCLKALDTEAAEESVSMTDQGGIAESPIDKLRKVAKADIWMQLMWTVNKKGPQHTLTFNLQGIDAYTNKQIAAASGTGEPSFSVELPVLLEEAIIGHIDQFNSQLQAHFDDLFENGREVSLECKRTNDSDVNFESEFDGDELSFLIEDWMAQNTVSGRFSTSDVTENRMKFEQVRIPLVNANGRALDTRNWANELRKALRTKYNIKAKLSTKGLGQAYIIIEGSQQ